MSEKKLSKLEQIRTRVQGRMKEPWVLGVEDGFDPPLVVHPMTAKQREAYFAVEDGTEKMKLFVGEEQWARLWEKFADEDAIVLRAVLEDASQHFFGPGEQEVPTKSS